MIWLIGCNGMLGQEVARQLNENKFHWVGTDKEVDITNPDALEDFERKNETSSYEISNLSHSDRQIKWIINCSAYTNVEKAEEDVELAEKINTVGPRNIARLARKIGAKLIHISTDYVFNGKGNVPYTEDLPKMPLGVYGKTKSDGEDEIAKEMTTYYIIRTAWLYGFDGKNFVYTMTNLMNNKDEIKVVNDQIGTPTCAVDLANVIIKFIKKSDSSKCIIGPKSAPAYGIYHFTNQGQISWFDFANKIYSLGKKHKIITNECVINPCTSQEFAAKVERPAYSVLSKEKISKTLKLKIPEWSDSLEKFIKSNRFNNSL